MRILDFAHAASAAIRIGEAVRAAGGGLPTTWLEGVLQRLKHQGPAKHLARLTARYPSEASQEKLSYLQKRQAHMQYPTYQEAGWLFGSGSVEIGPASFGEHGCIGCLTQLFTLPARPPLVVLALAIPGTHLFSDALLPPLRFQERLVQKMNRTRSLKRG